MTSAWSRSGRRAAARLQRRVGGGMGMTHNRPDTYPRVATRSARSGPDDLLGSRRR